MFRIALQLSDLFGISISGRALSCEAPETTRRKQEPDLSNPPGGRHGEANAESLRKGR